MSHLKTGFRILLTQSYWVLPLIHMQIPTLGIGHSQVYSSGPRPFLRSFTSHRIDGETLLAAFYLGGCAISSFPQLLKVGLGLQYL